MNELDLKENSNKTYAMFHKPRWYSTTESREITKTVPFVVVQSLSCDRLFVTPWSTAHQASLPFTISQSLLKPMSIELVMPSNHLISSVVPFSCPQSFPVSGSFPMIWLFASGGQSIGASASASVLLMNIQG